MLFIFVISFLKKLFKGRNSSAPSHIFGLHFYDTGEKLILSVNASFPLKGILLITESEI